MNAQPGITIPELADAMGIQANYLYRVMPALQKDGKVKKRGKGWHPALTQGAVMRPQRLTPLAALAHQAELLHGLALVDELLRGRVDLSRAEVSLMLQALDDLVLRRPSR